jgi:hypothetical protein
MMKNSYAKLGVHGLAVAMMLAFSTGLQADSPYPTLGPVHVADAAAQPRAVTQAAAPAVQNGPDLGYHPVSATAALALRQACWSRLRILDVTEEGWVRRGADLLDNKQAGHYYRNAAALDALKQLRNGRSHRIQASIWTWVPAPLGAALFAYIGGAVANVQYGQVKSDGTYYYSQETIGQKIGQDALVGAGVGLLLGAALGIPISLSKGHQAGEDDHNAAESFNRKLLSDLRLQAQPEPGGAKLGVDKSF